MTSLASNGDTDDKADGRAEKGTEPTSLTDVLEIPYAFAREHGIAIVGLQDDGLHVAMREGADVEDLLEVRRYLDMPFFVDPMGPKDYDSLLHSRYASAGDGAGMALGDEAGLDALASGIPSAQDILESADDAPVIRLINGLIAEAVRQGVSDIHIEPYEQALIIRMRQDGVLKEHLRMPASAASVVVSRIKVMSRLDIAERRVPQDGRIALKLGGRQFDVRVSTLPSRGGERVVMRILDRDQAGLSLDLIGMTGYAEEVMRDALAEPNGIILVTGPTGSGKTTSLYAALTHLNDGKRNILTVEDPVEYSIDGIGQTQVDTKVGMTFSGGLRAILRQDPDVVMVGEIRDRETADIAVQSSLTGHLVLSTVHTNDAIGSITRLRDMKIEPFLIASSLRAVIAQRLVRRLCETCREPVPADQGVAALLGFDDGETVYRAIGCDECGRTGYKGRIGVFEALRIDSTLRRMISEGCDESVLSRHAFLNAPNLGSAARALVRAGETSPEEAIRISRHEDVAEDEQ